MIRCTGSVFHLRIRLIAYLKQATWFEAGESGLLSAGNGFRPCREAARFLHFFDILPINLSVIK